MWRRSEIEMTDSLRNAHMADYQRLAFDLRLKAPMITTATMGVKRNDKMGQRPKPVACCNASVNLNAHSAPYIIPYARTHQRMRTAPNE